MSLKHIIGWVLVSPFIVLMLAVICNVLMDIIGDTKEAGIAFLLFMVMLTGLLLLLH
jgi:MFS superfamily sulfate permease-like transporter